ncbi:MAG: YdbH domain-containing protein [Pseudomonadota bacterium]
MASEARKCDSAMGSSETDTDQRNGRPVRLWLGRVAWALVALVITAMAYVWLTRERIATDLIDDYLAEAGLEASYDIVQIGLNQQIIENVVIGDPKRPDATIKRVIVDVSYTLGAPGIGAARLESPRVFATYRDGELSLGALDPLLFAESDMPSSGLPEIDLAIIDGGALIETDFGDVGVFIKGEGPLDDGFSADLALVAPGLGLENCLAASLTAFGELSTTKGEPRFKGPLRLRDAACGGADLASADFAVDVSTDPAFTTVSGDLNLASSSWAYAQDTAQSAKGSARFSVSQDALTVSHDLTFERVETDLASVGAVRADGTLRIGEGSSQTTWDAQVTGEGISPAAYVDSTIAEARNASEATLAAGLLAKLERNLKAATQGASLTGDVTYRLEDNAQSLVIPQARLISGAGETLVALSRFALGVRSADKAPRLVGNFLTGGTGLPEITGRMDQDETGAIALRLSMAEYSEGEDRVAIPGLQARQRANGSWLFSGKVAASGAIPGGAISSLEVPLTGSIGSSTGLRLGSRCTDIRVASLVSYDLAIEDQDLRVCPAGRQAILRYGNALEIDAQVNDLELTGEVGGSAFRLKGAQTTLSYPGDFNLADFSAVIGEPDNAVHLTSAALSGSFEDGVSGTFENASAKLDAVPLDLSEMAGRWAYDDETLRVSQASLTLTERGDERARFEPLIARDAVLSLSSSDIKAQATMRHPLSDMRIADLTIQHDLSTAKGAALLDVPEVTFGDVLAPEDLTYLAKGVIAFTEGTVIGSGQIEWTSDTVTSSGAFRTDNIDLAAAFGPVRGLKGEIRFSDLLNFTTEPSQVITIASINPGVEALAGTVQFSLTDGQIVEVEEARWPFMGGELVMRPTTLRYGIDEEQEYTFDITNLDAAKFIAEMELANLSATGTFNGTVPIIFNDNGDGRIEGGSLSSQAPGGNVSYIGELTYEDLGAVSNFAFQSLRSLDYKAMRVELDGSLAGEIITRFQIDGVSQGEAASRNFITRRLSKLPIRFNINVRSENFYKLATMVRTFWDPEALPDPVDQGVLSSDGVLLLRSSEPRPPSSPPDPPEPPQSSPKAGLRFDEPGVQPPESDDLP